MYKAYLDGCYKGGRKKIVSKRFIEERNSYFCKEQSKMPIFPKEHAL